MRLSAKTITKAKSRLKLNRIGNRRFGNWRWKCTGLLMRGALLRPRLITCDSMLVKVFSPKQSKLSWKETNTARIEHDVFVVPLIANYAWSAPESPLQFASIPNDIFPNVLKFLSYLLSAATWELRVLKVYSTLTGCERNNKRVRETLLCY